MEIRRARGENLSVIAPNVGCWNFSGLAILCFGIDRSEHKITTFLLYPVTSTGKFAGANGGSYKTTGPIS